ncbi:hypothetical protein [Dietzia sp. CH92]|uniref:hypothetical protein n=1 Tax=Dietzia sp. CH92 TaxID=3051823 RepID=UPI0028D05E1C|nr:hypothetical protein [Dietzia sp. CH92]
MRVQPGPRNRVVLALTGLLVLAAGVWLVGAASGLLTPDGPMGALAVPGDTTAASAFAEPAGWLPAAATAVAVLVALAGLALVISQIPRTPAHTVLRLHDEADGTPLAAVDPRVLERALAERAETVPGAEDVSVRVVGSAAALRVVAELTVAEDAEVSWTVDRARRRLSGDVATALGSAPLSVDVLVTMRNSRTGGRADSVALRGGDAVAAVRGGQAGAARGGHAERPAGAP